METRYSPTEGEALAVAVGLESSRYYTLGCRQLYVTTDHKPLLSILNDRALDTITNPRLIKLKERTLLWCFDLIYVPGNKQAAADTLSRKKKVAVLASLSVHVSQENEMERVLEADVLVGLREMVVSENENDLKDQTLDVMSVECCPAVIT